MCDKHGLDAIDDYMEFNDDLSDFEVIAKRLRSKNTTAENGTATAKQPRPNGSEQDFARHIIDECYNLEKMMRSLANFFDYEAYARELFMYDYTMGANNRKLIDRMGDNNVFRRV